MSIENLMVMERKHITTKKGMKYGFVLFVAVLFVPLLGWGQTSDDYSGVYYIGSVGYNSSIMLQSMTLRELTMGIPSSQRINAEVQIVTMKGRQYGPSKKLLILIIITSSKPALANIYFPMAKFARLKSIVYVYTLKQFLVISMTKHCLP